MYIYQMIIFISIASKSKDNSVILQKTPNIYEKTMRNKLIPSSVYPVPLIMKLLYKNICKYISYSHCCPGRHLPLLSCA